MADAELAEALVAGEEWALTETWLRFAPMVLTAGERAFGSKLDAEDLAQEVFVRVQRRAKTLRDPAALRSFVYSIALRTLRSELRHRRHRFWLSFHAPEELLDERSVVLDVESRDLLRRVEALLERLSGRDRLVFILRRVEQMSLEEIAATLDISESTVKRSLAYATARLLQWTVASNPRRLTLARASAALR